jgi:hypothetical protein
MGFVSSSQTNVFGIVAPIYVTCHGVVRSFSLVSVPIIHVRRAISNWPSIRPVLPILLPEAQSYAVEHLNLNRTA